MDFMKQSVGIDISKDTFAASFALMDSDQRIHFRASHLFSNNRNGFEKFTTWASNQKIHGPELWYIMEATGVYYENLAYYLAEQTSNVSVLVPTRALHFAKSLEIKTKTDKVDARILAQLGLERRLERWKIVSPKIKQMKELSREFSLNKVDLTRFKNRVHAKLHSHQPNLNQVERLKRKITLLEEHCLAIEIELQDLVASDPVLQDKIEKLTSIPGIGFITAISIISETNGFAAIRNAKQLASYAGLDVQHSQSGLKTGKSKMSKKGNKYLRYSLYMPALSALQHNAGLKALYKRIIQNKPSKKIGVVAVARKMLILAYILWKNDEFYHHERAGKSFTMANPS